MSKDNKNPLDVLKALEDTIENNINMELSDEIPHDQFTNPNIEKNDNGKSRVWVMLLYPDNEMHGKILETVYTDFVAIGAHHDQDVTKDGKKCKDHVHVVLYFTSPVYKTHITSKYRFYEDIDKWVHKRSDVKRQVRYLLHRDSPSKYQYPDTYLEGNVDRFQKYFDKELFESNQVLSIINLIQATTRSDKLHDLLIMICENGLYSAYRRNAYTFNRIFDEIQVERRDMDDRKSPSL